MALAVAAWSQWNIDSGDHLATIAQVYDTKGAQANMLIPFDVVFTGDWRTVRPRMPYRVTTGVALSLLALAVQGSSCAAADVHGTIQLHPRSAFGVVTSRIDANYTVSTSNTNDFSLKAAAYSGAESVVAVAADGTQSDVSLDYRLAGPGAVLQGITQTIHLELQSAEDITWSPEAIERPGYTTYRYQGMFSPKAMSFDPPVVFTLYDEDTQVGMTGKPVRELRFKGKPLISLHVSSIGLSAHRVSLELEGGLSSEDRFLIASDTTPLKKPELGVNTEIVFIATSGSTGVPFELYYPTAGPHVFTFPKGFDCNDFRINETHVLRNSAYVSTGIFRIPAKWYHPFGTSYDPTAVTFNITFDDPTTYIYNLRITSGTRFLNLQEDRLNRLATDDGSKNELTQLASDRVRQLAFPLSEFARQPAWYPLTIEEFIGLTPRSDKRDSLLQALSRRRPSVASIELPIVSAEEPITVGGRFAPPNGTPLGSYDGDLLVSGANLERVHIPVKYELYDPIGPAKQIFGGVMVALLTSYLGWALFDRRRKMKEAAGVAAAARYEFIREHYADLLELKRRIAQTLQPNNMQWIDVEGDVRWLMRRKLQSILSPTNWNRLKKAISTQDAGECCRVFTLELKDLEYEPDTGRSTPETGA
jgi:hypothetical protein